MSRTSRLLAATFAIAAFAAPAFAGTNVHVFLWDSLETVDMADDHKIEDHAARSGDAMGLAVSATTLPAGEITFDVLNTAQDIEHEMVISPLASADATLPFDPEAMAVDEEAAGSPGEVAELAPGQSGSLTLTLEPGTYVLYCNIPGHYAAGMWTLITVE